VKKIIVSLLGIVSVMSLVLSGWGCTSTASAPTSSPATKPAEIIKWRLQTGQGPDEPFIAVYCRAVIDLVKEKGKGALEIQLLAPGEILAGAQTFQGVIDGKVEMGGSASRLFASLLPEATIEFGLPYSLANSDQFYDFHYKYKDGALLKSLQEAYREKGTQRLAVVGLPVAIITKFPINKADDLIGKKLVAASGGGATSPLGFSIVEKPEAEHYAALQAGAADGANGPLQNITGFKLAEVTSYISLPLYNWGAHDLYCNLAAFNKLPAEIKKAIQEAAVEAALNVFVPKDAAIESGYIEAGKKAGMTVITLPDEEVAKIRALVLPMWDGQGRATPRCAAMVDMLKSYLKEKGGLK
jgi:TRAP-type C4-dicarboxylate transport system substrate-binding protein